MIRIVIRHTVGSKANQVEEFPLDRVEDLTIGRDPQATVRFDPDKDDLVSRRHARIIHEKSDRLAFKIVDLNSSNGLFVNGAKVVGEAALLPGDEIHLGLDGPRFVFDVEPRPDYMVARTRILPVLASGFHETASPKATTLSSSAPRSTAAPESQPASQGGYRSSVGRATVERLIAYQSRISRRVLYGTAAGVLGAVLAGGGALYEMQRSSQDRLAGNVNERLQSANATVQAANAAISNTKNGLLDKYGAKTALEIANENADAVVMIRASWKLFDVVSGKQLFQKYVSIDTAQGKALVPAYVQTPRGLVYWLTTEDGFSKNQPIGSGGSGSGFVVSNNGFVMTNKHVAADWLRPYEPPEKGVGAVYQQISPAMVQQWMQRPPPPSVENVQSRVENWTPSQGIVFDSQAPVSIDGGSHPLTGHSDTEVLFPRNKISAQAHFVRASDQADVALIKVDMPDALNMVKMASKDYALKLGEPISVMGYPAISPKRIAVTTGQDLTGPTQVYAEVPEPTVTNGIVAKLNSREVSVVEAGSNVSLFQLLPDYFQLTVNATGAGNSGGPVFNSEGKVIGLFTAGKWDPQGTHVTLAVPIKYGWEIFGLNPVIQSASK